MKTTDNYKAILTFWFERHALKDWFAKNDAFDQKVSELFSDIHRQACLGELWQWRQSSEGCLAEIIVLDQFSRNLFRGKPQSFAYDGMALTLAQQAVTMRYHLALDGAKRAFLFMPYMHSESLVIHHQAVELFKAPGLESYLDYEYKHLAIIEKFGRYPHRNAVLGRQSTAEEIDFLKQSGSGF
ncbi:MAG: DUF924 family protein [Pseudomonadota bacterium]